MNLLGLTRRRMKSMKTVISYGLSFAWAVLFLYYFGHFAPKNIGYFVIGIPSLGITSYLVFQLFMSLLKQRSI